MACIVNKAHTTSMTCTANPLEKQRTVWMWKSNIETDEWRRYSGIENLMIELAYQQNKTQVELDDFWIDFKDQIQIDKKDSNKSKQIKRVTNMPGEHVRTERFMLDEPKLTAKSFDTKGGAFLPAAGFWLAEINDELVEKADVGIEEAAAKLGKRKEAEFMANALREVNEKWNKKWNRLKQNGVK